MPQDERVPAAATLRRLHEAQIEIEGRLPWSSNHTFLVRMTSDGSSFRAIYKPHDGEQPLWDFPSGLYRREVAAYVLSKALGWPRVPETIVRENAPFGVGSLQRFVPADFSQHYFTLVERTELRDELLAFAVFDIIANNADRKSGHCLISEEGELFAIDHGLCFNVEHKLRTVLWDFGGDPVPEQLLVDVARVLDDMPGELTYLLDDEEVAALRTRMHDLLSSPALPVVSSPREYPWPLV